MRHRLIAASLAAAAGVFAADAPRPDVILILADDLGYETLGCNGSTSYRTPNLDRMAAEGLRFTNAHVQPLCTPTRMQLMTGLSNRRNYKRFAVMPEGTRTFGHVLHEAGYATAVMGKWQLGEGKDHPRAAGFDSWLLWHHVPPGSGEGNPRDRYWGAFLVGDGGRVPVAKDVYGPDVQLAAGERWMDQARPGPYFFYYPTQLTHDPFVAAPTAITDGKPAQIPAVAGDQAAFGTMVGHLDRQVGHLLDRLRTSGRDKRTLVIFLGDNGTGRAITSQCGGQAVPGGKGLTSDRGTHVPCIAWWPGRVAPGVADDLVESTDILPTLAELAGAPAPKPCDGVSLAPRLLRGTPSPRQAIYGWYAKRMSKDDPPAVWARDRRWKLYEDGRMFDVVADPEEKTPAANPDPQARAALQAELARYAGITPLPFGGR